MSPRTAGLALCAILLAVPAARAASESDLARQFPAVDRSLYRYAGRLSDDELRIFIGLRGDQFPPGSRLPLWADRLVERWLAQQEGKEAQEFEAPGGPQDATVGPNVSVSQDPTRVQSESFIAINRANPQRIVGASNQINADPQMLFWSVDGGTSWNHVEMKLGAATFHSDPGVCWDSKGAAYASSLGITGSTVQVQVVKTTDEGRTWSAPVVPSQGGGYDKELIAANDQAGTACQDLVCVAWDDVPGLGALKVSCAPGGTGTWTTKTIATGEVIGAIPAFGPDGELFVAWSAIGRTRIEIARSDDCGNTWSQPVPVGTTRTGYDMAVPAMCDRRALVYPALDVDRSAGPQRGWLYAVWTDSAPGTSCPASCSGCPSSNCALNCSSNVYFARSEDGGVSWTAPVTVHTDTNKVDQFNPWLAVDDFDGAVHVAWNDSRDDSSRLKTHIYYRRSTDGGKTWEPEQKVTSGQTDETDPGADGNQYGDYNGLAAFQCHSYPIWTDRRTLGNEQIFSADVSSCVAGGACCLATGSCIEVTSGSCGTQGGTYRGDGTSCPPNPACPLPTGACCLPSGSCVVVTSASCLAQSGTYRSNGTSCPPAPPCPQPTGACCLPSGSCSALDGSACASQGGTWRGEGTTCPPSPPCPPATGACCLSDGSCSVVDPANCSTGTYRGNGTTCPPSPPCPLVTGACCLTNGTCIPTDATGCSAGTYRGDGTSCPPSPPCALVTGACCLGDGTCIATDATGCSTGTYRGDGTTCPPTPPCPAPGSGVCCLPAGGCAVLDASACAAQSGTFEAGESLCRPAPPDLGNSLRAVKDATFRPRLSWTDLGSGERDYRAYRGSVADFVGTPPALIGTSGGGDVVVYTDTMSPVAPGVSFYKVRGMGSCWAEGSGW